MNKQELVVIKAEVMWCKHNKPDDNGNYQIELTNLSPKAVEALESIGVEALSNPEKPEKGMYIRPKSKYPIKVLDSDGDVITTAIGNGSKAKAVIGSYAWQFKAKKGVSPSIKKIVITDLVEYNEGDDEFSSLMEEEEAL